MMVLLRLFFFFSFRDYKTQCFANALADVTHKASKLFILKVMDQKVMFILCAAV